MSMSATSSRSQWTASGLSAGTTTVTATGTRSSKERDLGRRTLGPSRLRPRLCNGRWRLPARTTPDILGCRSLLHLLHPRKSDPNPELRGHLPLHADHRTRSDLRRKVGGFRGLPRRRGQYSRAGRTQYLRCRHPGHRGAIAGSGRRVQIKRIAPDFVVERLARNAEPFGRSTSVKTVPAQAIENPFLLGGEEAAPA